MKKEGKAKMRTMLLLKENIKALLVKTLGRKHKVFLRASHINQPKPSLVIFL
jgi:hypothetical protein